MADKRYIIVLRCGETILINQERYEIIQKLIGSDPMPSFITVRKHTFPPSEIRLIKEAPWQLQ